MRVRLHRAVGPALMMLMVAAVALPARGETPSLVKMKAPSPNRAKADLIAAKGRLDSYLNTGGADYAAAWKKFLSWDSLEAELAKSQPDALALGKVLAAFHFNKPGLELPQFTDVRNALRRYQVLAVATAENVDFRYEYESARARCEDSPTRENMYALGRVIGELEITGQIDSHTATELRRPWSHPNSFIFVSSRVANHFVTRDIKEKEFINATIAGAQTSGWMNADCVLTVESRPNPNEAILELKLSGKTYSPHSVSHRGRVTVVGSNSANLVGRTPVILSFDGLKLGQTTAGANVNVQIRDIQMESQLLERIARRQAEKKLPEAEQAGARETEARVRKKLEDQAKPLIEQANATFEEKVKMPMARLGIMSTPWAGSTDERGVQFCTSEKDPFQLAAPEPPPTWKDGLDFALCIHNSTLENSAETILAGREIHDKQWLDIIEMLTGRAPRAIWVHSRTERWSTVLATERPLEMQFHNGCIRVAFNFDEVSHADERHRVNARVEACFHPVIMPDGLMLHREGNLTIDVSSQNLSADDVEEVRALLQHKFGGILQEDVYFDGLAPPAGGFGSKMRQIKLESFRLEDSWCRIGYKLYDVPAGQVKKTEDRSAKVSAAKKAP